MMERYNKYLVLKNADIEKHLSDEKQLKLDALVAIIRIGRLEEGKGDQQYVVVAADWPMYEDTWKSIEAFVDGKPSELQQLRAELISKEQQLAASQAENLRLRKALENCRLLAARHRKEEWASHVLRFCDDAGVSGKVLRHNPPGDQSALREVIARVLEERGQAQRIGNADYGTDPYYLLIGNAAQLRSGEWIPEALK